MENLKDYQYSNKELKEMGYSKDCDLPVAFSRRDVENLLHTQFPSKEVWEDFKDKFKNGKYKIEVVLF